MCREDHRLQWGLQSLVSREQPLQQLVHLLPDQLRHRSHLDDYSHHGGWQVHYTDEKCQQEGHRWRHHVGAGSYIPAGISSLASFGWTITRQSMQTSWRQRRMSVLWQRCHEGKLLFCHDGVHSACFSLWNIIVRFWKRSEFIWQRKTKILNCYLICQEFLMK